MNSNSAWVEFKSSDFSKSVEKRDAAVMYASVFDIPQEMCLQKDNKEIDLIIGYLSGDSEPLTRKTCNDVRFSLGVSSGRIYKIEINSVFEKNKYDKILLINLKKAMNSLKECYSEKISKNNYSYVSKIINENFESLAAMTFDATTKK